MKIGPYQTPPTANDKQISNSVPTLLINPNIDYTNGCHSFADQLMHFRAVFAKKFALMPQKSSIGSIN